MSEVIKWQELKPEQRDALIAEKVMGLKVEHWTERERETVDEDGNPETWSLRTGYVVIDGLSNPYVLRYTEDMSAAWQVVEKLGKVGESNVYIGYVPQAYSRCKIDFYAENKSIEEFGDTPMEAICLAALKAFGIEIENS